MIHVERAAAAPPAVLQALTRPLRGTTRTELDAARNYYAQAPKPSKAYHFTRYKDPAVCAALDDLYHEKCAYCESIYRAVDVRDVEHFRPKGGVKESPTHPGYWWLASEWSNLLPSCPPCNQWRKQYIAAAGAAASTATAAANVGRPAPSSRAGKANAFPMRPPTSWAISDTDDLGLEDPLLINPSVRDPALHLDWVFELTPGAQLWEAEWISPILVPRRHAAAEDPYGRRSIDVYGLNREGLWRERMARVKLIQASSRAVLDALLDLGSANVADRPLRLSRLRDRRRELEAHLQVEQPYTSMARAYVERYDAAVAIWTGAPATSPVA
jgi:hypothetical protein